MYRGSLCTRILGIERTGTSLHPHLSLPTSFSAIARKVVCSRSSAFAIFQKCRQIRKTFPSWAVSLLKGPLETHTIAFEMI